MKIFGFIKKVFFVGLTILSGFAGVNSLNCISMNNQVWWIIKCVKQDPRLLMWMGMSPCFFHLVLKQVNVVVVA